MELKQLTNNEFKEFSKNYELNSMYQTVNYAFTMNEEKCDTIFLGFLDNSVIKCASLIIIKKKNGFLYAEAPRGFLIDYNDFTLLKNFTKAIKKFLGKRDVVAIKISPLIYRRIYNSQGEIIKENNDLNHIFDNLKRNKYYHLGYNNYFEAMKPRYEAICNINSNYIQMFANIKKNLRNKVRKADRCGIKVYHGNISNLDLLYKHTKGKYPRDIKYFKNLYNFFSKDNLIDFYYSKLDTTEYIKISQNIYSYYEKKCNDINNLLLEDSKNDKLLNDKMILDKNYQKSKKQLKQATIYLRDNPAGIILSSALIIKWQNTAYIIIDGYDENYKNFNAKHLLVWKLMIRYSKLGFKNFNLGGVVNPEKVNKKYKGLNEFKLSFGSNIVEYIGDFELITNSPLYFMYQKRTNLNNMLKK